MNKNEITLLLSTLLERDVLGYTWSKEVSYSKLESEKSTKCREVGGRVDYVSFSPRCLKQGYDITEQDVSNGCFTAYEIKSSLMDFKSGCGLNFIGEYNYLVVSMDFYNELINKNLIPDKIGILAPVPMYKGKQTNKFFDNAIHNPSPLTNSANDWRMHRVKKAERIERRHGTSELLYAMLRSGK